jgi:hypothetical protein
MEDLSAKLEKLLIEAEDCELIGRLATEPNKRELFKRLAVDLRGMAQDIKAMISTRTLGAVSYEIKDGCMVPKGKELHRLSWQPVPYRGILYTAEDKFARWAW